MGGLYDKFRQYSAQTWQAPQQQGPPINVQQFFPNQPGANAAFMQFAQGLQGRNPQEMVQALLNSGQMSQDQFNQFAQMANMITGRH